MELEFGAQFLIISFFFYVVSIGAYALVDIKKKTVLQIKKSSHELVVIFYKAIYGVKIEKVNNLEVLSIILYSNHIVNFFLVGLILCFYIIFSIMETIKIFRREMSERLPYIFLTIYFGSLGLLLIHVFFMYLITYINMETLHIIDMVLQKGVSWCSAHTYILRYIMELEFGAQFLIISLLLYVVSVGVYVLVDIKKTIILQIKESSHQLTVIFYKAIYGVKI